MSGQITFRINTAQFRQQVSEFERATGKSGYVLYREMFRVLLETMYHWTAPPTKGRGAGGRKAGGRRGGQKAVTSDVMKTTRSVSPGYMYMLLGITNGATHIDNLRLTSKSGNEYTLRNIRLVAGGDMSEINAHHQSRRGSTNNRVPGRDRPRRVNEDKAFTTARATMRFLKEEQKKVGKLKSGWAPALSSIGSRLPPAWVLRAGGISGNSGRGAGTRVMEKGQIRETLTGSFVADNLVPYFGDPSMLNRAHKQSEKRMQRHGQQWIDQQIRKHNKKVASQ